MAEKTNQQQLFFTAVTSVLLFCVGMVCLYVTREVSTAKEYTLSVATTTQIEVPTQVTDTPVVNEVNENVVVPPPVGASTTKQEEAITQESRMLYSFGLSLGETLSVASEAEVAHILDDLAALGVGWIRVDLAWNSIQPTDKDTYQWGAFDTIVSQANRVGILVLPIVTYTPHWARSEACRMSSKCEPADPEAFALFAQRAVERYAPKGVYAWEIWNEPNIKKFWAGGANYARYTELLKYTYLAIHEVDVDAVVISGGLAPTSTGKGNITAREFLEGMYESGAKSYFDAVGFHPYSFPLAPTDLKATNAWSQMDETEWSVRSIMRAYGDAQKKVWLTEYGAPTGGPGKSAADGSYSLWSPLPDHVSEAYQVTLLKEAFEQSQKYSWAGPLFWYSYKDLGTSDDTIENFFGLRRYDGSKKPAFSMVELLLQEYIQ